MKKHYFVIDTETKDGKMDSFVIAETHGENLLSIASRYGAVGLEICETREQAERIAAIRVASYRRNGTWTHEQLFA